MYFSHSGCIKILRKLQKFQGLNDKKFEGSNFILREKFIKNYLSALSICNELQVQ